MSILPPVTAASGEELTGLVGWVADVIATFGAWGVAALIAVENLFPPIPSEVVLPFAGFLAGRGDLDPWTMVVAATVGSVLGAVVLYELGRAVGRERTGRLLVRLPLVSGDDVQRASDWFERHGRSSVLVGRFVPLVRSLVSLPAGADGMPRPTFLLLTTVGSAVWNAAWVWAGHALGSRWEQAGRWSDALNLALLVVAVALVGRFAWRRRPAGRATDADRPSASRPTRRGAR